jgi:hypothetical protein
MGQVTLEIWTTQERKTVVVEALRTHFRLIAREIQEAEQRAAVRAVAKLEGLRGALETRLA